MGSVQTKDLTSVQAAIALPLARTNANAAGAVFMPPSAYAHRRGPRAVNSFVRPNTFLKCSASHDQAEKYLAADAAV